VALGRVVAVAAAIRDSSLESIQNSFVTPLPVIRWPLSSGLRLLAVALTLPAVASVHAEAPPDHGQISFKLLDYKDSQPGQDRINVSTPGFSIMTPIGTNWSVAAKAVVDSISGASPAYHTQALTQMHDERRAADAAATRYYADGTYTFGINYSTESDYISRGLSLGATRSSADKNTTWNVGLNMSSDDINPTNHTVVGETKQVQEYSLGITQVMSQHDIAQLIVGYFHGTGYFSDPYKIFDNRPRERNESTALLRWNHFFDATGGTTRWSYRYFGDSYGIQAHTIAAEYVQPLNGGWTVTPAVRLYSQSAASFYVDSDPASGPGPTHPPASAIFYTEDQRLAAYGAHSVGLTVAKQLSDQWQVDLKANRYDQASSFSFSGSGSPNLAPFTAITYQIGMSKRF
jgi:hypothetical protein